METVTTKNISETKKTAARLAKNLVKVSKKGARVVGLVGELGAGKTTFVQGFAAALGIKEKVQSPTFVLMKVYPLVHKTLRHLVHIDCYRLDSPEELLHLGFKDILKDRDAIVLIEWADKIQTILPHDTLWIRFSHGLNSRTRKLEFMNYEEIYPH